LFSLLANAEFDGTNKGSLDTNVQVVDHILNMKLGDNTVFLRILSIRLRKIKLIKIVMKHLIQTQLIHFFMKGCARK